MTQADQILRHFKRRKTITSLQAFELYRITRLSHVAFVLRRRGYNLINEPQVGNGTTYARYRLVA